MASWLFKTDPETYSWRDLKSKKTEVWDGVKNPLALKHLRSVKTGDEILIYHSGEDKAIVGIASAVSEAYPDPKDNSGKLFAMDIAPVRDFPKPVLLSAVKAEPALKEWELVRMSRLSVMPVSASVRKLLFKLAS
ncbi:MAG TPA: EVE domain-containing protein [bacterium]|nr:EVE domain-containing protein [bacterium]